MSADFSRQTFDPKNDFSAVLMQQGRVQLDADWNELVEILNRRWRAETIDIIGRCVVPTETPEGFQIQAAEGKLTIGRGRIYVDGLLAENHGSGDLKFDSVLAELRGAGPVEFDKQPYQPSLPENLPEKGLVYLDVWQREVTFIEDPNLIERAVGVDTTARLQTVWQVKIHPVGGTATCQTPDNAIPNWADVMRHSAGRLSTGTTDVPAEQDFCILPPGGGYRGLENQLYRVEIHHAGTEGGDGAQDVATFKWSRDNASVVSAVRTIDGDGTQITVDSVGRDSVLRFNIDDWVEITNDVREFAGKPGEIRKIMDIVDETRTILLNEALPTVVGEGAFSTEPEQIASRHTRIRRWDQNGEVRDKDGNLLVNLDASGSTGLIPVPAPDTSILLEHGVTVTFSTEPEGGAFRTGDYWVFWARTVDAKPELLEKAPPRGIHHHYCRLAMVTFPATVEDCRIFWPAAAKLTHICAINWVHPRPPFNDSRNNTALERLKLARFDGQFGVLIAFDQRVRSGDIHRHSFIVLAEHKEGESGRICWCDLAAKTLKGVNLSETCKISSEVADVDEPFVNAAVFIPNSPFESGTQYRVILKGDLIRDENGKAVDADHLPDWLPRRPTGDGVEGGTFESWFRTSE
jgi:hypothetical protein